MSASHYRSSKSLELSVLFSAQPDSNEQKIAVAIPPPKFNFFLLFRASSVLLPFGFKANGNGRWGEGTALLQCCSPVPTWVRARSGACWVELSTEVAIISLSCWRSPSRPNPISFWTESCTEAKTSDKRRENISSRNLRWEIRNSIIVWNWFPIRRDDRLGVMEWFA